MEGNKSKTSGGSVGCRAQTGKHYLIECNQNLFNCGSDPDYYFHDFN
jgi:hypothetical protein